MPFISCSYIGAQALSLTRNASGRRHLAAKATDRRFNVGDTSANRRLAVDIQSNIGLNCQPDNWRVNTY